LQAPQPAPARRAGGHLPLDVVAPTHTRDGAAAADPRLARRRCAEQQEQRGDHGQHECGERRQHARRGTQQRDAAWRAQIGRNGVVPQVRRAAQPARSAWQSQGDDHWTEEEHRDGKVLRRREAFLAQRRLRGADARACAGFGHGADQLGGNECALDERIQDSSFTEEL